MRHAGVLGCGIGMVGAAVLMTAECATLFALGGCETELPGMVYQVRLSAPPEIEECVKLGEAISTATDVTAAQPYYQEFRPWSSRKTCLLTLTGRNESGPCQISVSTSTTNPIIALSITMVRFKKLSPSCEDTAHRVRALLAERYPAATILDLHPVRGPFAP